MPVTPVRDQGAVNDADVGSDFIAPLTSMRFFAAAAVIVLHSGGPFLSNSPVLPAAVKHLLANGYLGVTFFFVLSGFILQRVYAGRLLARHAVARYWEARFARIYPIYILALLLMSLWTFDLSWYAVPQFFLTQMWLPAVWKQPANWNMPAWTLSVEFAFYLVFPLVSAFSARCSRGALTTIAAACFLAVIATRGASVVSGTEGAFDWMVYVPVPMLRLPEFVAGIMLAQLTLRADAWRTPAWMIPASGATLVVVTAATTDPAISGLATLICGVLIYAVTQSPKSIWCRSLYWRPVVIAGAASYSLYLLHQPVHLAVTSMLSHGLLARIAQFPILAVAALTAFRMIEEPARESLRRWFGIRRSTIGRSVISNR